jgi:L-ascorbate metabolism protein UlaG (beta-lactamase superfamily)
VLKIEGVTIYHTGDGNSTLAMRDVAADIAMIPVGGEHGMTTEEAAHAVKAINPRVVIPLLTGIPSGADCDLKEFAEMAQTMVISPKPKE